jgi:hypothetical protein
MILVLAIFMAISGSSTTANPAIVAVEPAVQAPESPVVADPSARVFRGIVLDRETLQPVPDVQVTRFDGKVAVRGDSHGVFAFPMDLDQFGRCVFTDSGVACSMDDPKTTSFFVRGADISPMLVSARKYRDWGKSSTLFVWRKATLRGTWLDARGNPVVGRDLELACGRLLPSESEEEFPKLRVTTNDKGEFLFDAVPANVSFALRTASKDDALAELDVTALVLAPAEAREVRLHSLATTRMHGIVLDSEGHPAAEAEVRLERGDRKIAVDTASDGSFVFDRVGIGHVQLEAVHPGTYGGTQQGEVLAFDLAEGVEDNQVDVQLHVVREITGRVVDAQHEPVPDASVCFEPVATPCCGRSSFESCDGGGNFLIPRVISKECRLIAGMDDGPVSSIETVPAGSLGVEIVLQPTGRITGRVRRPVPDQKEQFGVYARRTTTQDVDPLLYAGGDSILIQVQAGSDEFELATVPAGTWRIHASIDERQVSCDRDVTVTAGQSAVCADLVLKPMTRVELISSTKCGDLDVEIRYDTDAIVRQTLARGRVSIVEIPVGKATIVARDAGRIVCEKPLELAAGSLQIVGLGFER